MCRTAMLFGLAVAATAVAAPVPKDEAGRIARVYGLTHDPAKGAEFRNVGDRLFISVPPETRLLAPWRKIVNAPRVWREVRGPFVVTVRVAFPIRPTLPARHDDPAESRSSGGLVVWMDEERFLTLTRDERENDGKPGEYYRSEWCNKDSIRGSADYATPGRSGYLRVDRWEKGLKCGYSPDGKIWTPVGSYLIDWPDPLKVGVVAENGFKAPFEAALDEYTLTPTKQ